MSIEKEMWTLLAAAIRPIHLHRMHGGRWQQKLTEARDKWENVLEAKAKPEREQKEGRQQQSHRKKQSTKERTQERRERKRSYQAALEGAHHPKIRRGKIALESDSAQLCQ